MSSAPLFGLGLPITATFAVPLSAYYLYLQTRVINQRIATQKFVEQSASSSPTDPLAVACRAQANFAENVPLALTLASIVELNGGSKKVLIGALSGLVVLRVLHADAGFFGKNATGPGRPVGYFGTQGVVAVLAGYAGWLVKDYWGL